MKKLLLCALLLASTGVLTSATSPARPARPACDAYIEIYGTDWCEEGLVPIHGYSSDPNATYSWRIIGTGANVLGYTSQDAYIRIRSNANFQLQLTVNGSCSSTTETLTYQDFVDLCN